MPRTTHQQTKAEKADYDKRRKAMERRERRFTKPLKLFFQRKYSILYKEYVKFFNDMHNKYPGKKDLTKTEMFRDFLTAYPAEIEQVEVLETSSSPVETISIAPVQTTTYPAEIEQVEVLETSSSPVETSSSPVETISIAPVQTTTFPLKSNKLKSSKHHPRRSKHHPRRSKQYR